MRSLWLRFLVSIDLRIGYDTRSNDSKSGYVLDFYTSWWPRMAILNKDGEIRANGSWFSVQHCRDKRGKIVSRTWLRNTIQQGEQLIYGVNKINAAYLRETGSLPCVM